MSDPAQTIPEVPEPPDPPVPPVDMTQTAFVVADATGFLVLTGIAPKFTLPNQLVPAGGQLVEGQGSASTHYVVGSEILPRPANPAVLAGMSLSALPNPCTVSIDGTAHPCTDGQADLEFTQPGTYTLVVSAFPMADATFQVTQP
jgi:hypothetical protein